jgi:hypothetical protein
MMKTEALPTYNIAHHTPNANRRERHRDLHDGDAHGEVETDLSRLIGDKESCLDGAASEKDGRAPGRARVMTSPI